MCACAAVGNPRKGRVGHASGLQYVLSEGGVRRTSGGRDGPRCSRVYLWQGARGRNSCVTPSPWRGSARALVIILEIERTRKRPVSRVKADVVLQECICRGCSVVLWRCGGAAAAVAVPEPCTQPRRQVLLDGRDTPPSSAMVSGAATCNIMRGLTAGLRMAV